jgi:hypothetical protein
MSHTKIKEEIDGLMSVIPHCQTRAEALEIQEEILTLEEELH